MSHYKIGSKKRNCLLHVAESVAPVLQKAEVRIINVTVCSRLMDDGITPRMICAGVLSGGIDACQVKKNPLLFQIQLHVISKVPH